MRRKQGRAGRPDGEDRGGGPGVGDPGLTPSVAAGCSGIRLLFERDRFHRVAEALALLPKDIDPREGTVRVLRGKGSKSRVVPIDPDALAVVQRWMDKREKLGIGPRRPLLCTLKGGPMADAYVREMLPRLARRAGIVKRVHAHGLRHTYAVDLRKENVDVGIISKALGHSNIGTTAIYLNHVLPRDVIEALRNRRWSGTEAAGAATKVGG